MQRSHVLRFHWAWSIEAAYILQYSQGPLWKASKSLRYSISQNSFQAEYRVTIPLVQNLQLTSRRKFHFGLARPGQARPKQNFCLEVNWRFCTSGMVTLYALPKCCGYSSFTSIFLPPGILRGYAKIFLFSFPYSWKLVCIMYSCCSVVRKFSCLLGENKSC